jgi:hypothetical protein
LSEKFKDMDIEKIRLILTLKIVIEKLNKIELNLKEKKINEFEKIQDRRLREIVDKIGLIEKFLKMGHLSSLQLKRSQIKSYYLDDNLDGVEEDYSENNLVEMIGFHKSFLEKKMKTNSFF